MEDKNLVVSQPKKEINTKPLDKSTNKVIKKIVKEKDQEELKDLTNLFNLNIAKKNIIRTAKLNDLMDTITSKIEERFEKRPDEFTNVELVKYLEVVQGAIEKATKNSEGINTVPTINYNQQNNVNINVVDTLDTDSKERVLEALKLVMSNANTSNEPMNEVVEEFVEEEQETFKVSDNLFNEED